MPTPILIAVALLVGPFLVLSLRHLRDYGLSADRRFLWGSLPMLAALLLLGHVWVVVTGTASIDPTHSFSPARAYWVFLLSGLAYAAAGFPHLLADSGRGIAALERLRLEWLIAIPAWMTLLLLWALA